MNRAGRDFLQWMRRALPFGRGLIWRVPLLYGLPVLYLVSVILYLIFPAEMKLDDADFYFHHLILLWFAAAYGIWRAVGTHPIYNTAYRNWLRTVPWTPAQPFPFGRDGLGGQDLVIAGVILALARVGRDAMPWWILSEFLFFYTLATLWTLACMKAWRMVYGLLWGTSLLLFPFYYYPSALVLGLALLAATATFAERRARRRFPWQVPEPLPCRGLDAVRMTFGLPADYERGLASVFGRGWLGLAVGLLAGWWVYLAGRLGAKSEFIVAGGALTFPIFFGLILTALRMFAYLSFTAPPLSVLGRLATGRLIIPGYDQVFLPPVAVGATIVWIVNYYDVPPRGLSSAAVLALGSAALFACVLGMGPSLRRWTLTGQYRTHIGFRAKLNPLIPSASPFQGLARRMDEAQRRTRLRRPVPQFKPEAFLLMKFPWAGSHDRYARMINWLTFATAAAFMVMIVAPFCLSAGWIILVSCPFIFFVFATFLLYSASRATLFHPCFQPAYREWLKTTPWRPGMALPLGPPGLVWRDAIYLGVYLIMLGALIAVWIGAERAANPYYLISYRWAFIVPGIAAFLFLGYYSFNKLRLFYRFGECGPVMALGALYGALTLLLPHPVWAVPCAAAVVWVCAWGEHRVLRRLPWSDENEPAVKFRSAMMNRDFAPILIGADNDKAGWLNAALSSRSTPPPFQGWERRALILLPAWWILAGVHGIPQIMPEFHHHSPDSLPGGSALVMMVYLLATTLGLVFRLTTFFQFARPPISLLGRLGTGRLIIPGFDRVFVTPLLVIVSMIVQTALILRTGAPGEWSAAAWVVSWSLLLLGGPPLRSWRLTAECRLATEPSANERILKGKIS